METKELIIPEGWEVKEIVGNKIILKEKKKELPKTWEECSVSAIYSNGFDEMIIKLKENEYRVISKGLGKATIALCKLVICRNVWWKQLDWEPNWKNLEDKYCIYRSCDGIDVKTYTYDCRVLAFPTRRIRDNFLDAFRDLIEEAKELL